MPLSSNHFKLQLQVMDVQQVCDAIMSIQTQSEERFQHLFESVEN